MLPPTQCSSLILWIVLKFLWFRETVGWTCFMVITLDYEHKMNFRVLGKFLISLDILETLRDWLQETLSHQIIKGNLSYKKSSQFADFLENGNPRIEKPQISRTPAFGSRCSLKIVLNPFYNPNWQLFTDFFKENSHFVAISSLIKQNFLQNAAIFRVLKNCKL